MITEDLFVESLLKPAREGANKLKVISGYATSAMAFHHLEKLKELQEEVDISLIIGMCPSDGISLSNHKGFLNILESEYSERFRCAYLTNSPQVHSKAYIWSKDNTFYKSFIGSANYTQNAFSRRQREILEESFDSSILDYYSLLENESIFCNHNDTENLITIYNDRNYYRSHLHEDEIDSNNLKLTTGNDNIPCVTISLLSTRSGEVQNVGGLNWGQRAKRNPNQAYIQLPPSVYNSDFFPLRTNHFTVITDDSKTFICTRAQKSDEGQAIETPHNNSLLGEYFRNRLNLANGAKISKQDLEKYGRTDVTFYKFDDENYYLDFSVNPNNELL